MTKVPPKKRIKKQTIPAISQKYTVKYLLDEGTLTNIKAATSIAGDNNIEKQKHSLNKENIFSRTK